MYHNTTNLTGNELRSKRCKAQTQEDVIYQLFKGWHALTASEALLNYRLISGKNPPLTSIRRAITDLSKPLYHADGRLIRAAKLERTDQKRTGPYGAPEYVYKLKTF